MNRWGILAILVFVPTVVWGANWATEWTQIMNNIQLYEQRMNQIKQIYNDTVMIKNQMESLKSIATYKGQMQGIFSAMDRVNDKISETRSIYDQIQGVYQRSRDVFPEAMNKDGQEAVFDATYDAMTRTTQSAMDLAAAQSKTIEEEQKSVRELLHKSDNAVGQTQALQVMNQLMGTLINQMMVLRQLNAAQIAQLNYQAERIEMEKKESDEIKTIFHKYEDNGHVPAALSEDF